MVHPALPRISAVTNIHITGTHPLVPTAARCTQVCTRLPEGDVVFVDANVGLHLDTLYCAFAGDLGFKDPDAPTPGTVLHPLSNPA